MQLAFVLRILLKQIHFVSPINLIKLLLFSLFSRQDVLFLCGRDGKRVIQDSSFKRETACLLTPGHFEAVDIINDYQVLCLVAQSCLTLCNPKDCSPPGSSVHGDSPGKNTGAGCHALLQRIFPTQGSNPGLPHSRWILYYLSHQEHYTNWILFFFLMLSFFFLWNCEQLPLSITIM